MKVLRRALEQLRQFPFLETLCLPVIVFLLSACQVADTYAPWGLAAVAGSNSRKGFAGAVGAIIGALAFFEFQPGVRYGAAAILIYCGSLAFSGTSLESRPWFRPLLAAGMLLIVQSVYLIGRPLSVTLMCLAAAACTALCTKLWGFISLPASLPDPIQIAPTSPGSAAAFHALYDSFFHGTQSIKPENPSVLFDRAAEKICRDCALRTTCWQADYTTTYDAFNDACPKLIKRGRAKGDDFPIHFSSRCLHFPELLTAINEELYAFLLREQYHRRLQDAQAMAQRQYARVGELLETAPKAVSTATVGFMRYRAGSALRPKSGESVCGDQLVSFQANGSLYLLLSDGMGSGDAAHAEAAMTVRLLQQFLTAGIEPLPALRTLNGALRLRGQSGGGYTTIDLLQLSLQGDRAALFKYGAPCSYYKNGAQVISMGNQSLPVGLEADDELPDVCRFTPEDGSVFVMVSDGILAEGDTWLLNLLQEWVSGNPDTLAGRILSESAQHGGLSDDCAVFAVCVEYNSQNTSKAV